MKNIRIATQLRQYQHNSNPKNAYPKNSRDARRHKEQKVTKQRINCTEVVQKTHPVHLHIAHVERDKTLHRTPLSVSQKTVSNRITIDPLQYRQNSKDYK